MFLVIKKNFNIFILLFLLNISYFGLEDFISFESQKTDQQLEKSYSGINTPLENQKTNNQLIRKKVQENKIEDFKIANYESPDFFSDYNFNEIDMDLNLVPVSEKILFSGIPVPEAKPLPEITSFSKHISLSIDSKKLLEKVLDENAVDMHQKKKYL